MAPGPHAPLPPPLSCPRAQSATLAVPRGSGCQTTGDRRAEGGGSAPSPHSLPKRVVMARAPPPASPLHPLCPGPRVSRVAAARPGGGNVPGQILALLSQVSHPRGSVLMRLNPGSLFSAPGNSHTGADTLCPSSLGSSSSVTTDRLLETV